MTALLLFLTFTAAYLLGFRVAGASESVKTARLRVDYKDMRKSASHWLAKYLDADRERERLARVIRTMATVDAETAADFIRPMGVSPAIPMDGRISLMVEGDESEALDVFTKDRWEAKG